MQDEIAQLLEEVLFTKKDPGQPKEPPEER